MNLSTSDTIVAIASAPGGAGRGILRASGPEVPRLLSELLTERPQEQAIARSWATQLRLDRGRLLPCQVYFWPDERSYTRQTAAEFHLPGSPPLLEAALARSVASGARLAAPGEFTLRAFMAGRLDLTQAEAVLGVIDSQSRGELDRALAQLAGGLSTPLAKLRDRLLDLLSHLEAGLDFVEEDIEFISAAELTAALEELALLVKQLQLQLGSRQRSTHQARVVLYGWPNVGKSELFNALIGRAEAIVAEVAGTTRDWLAAEVSFAGQPCELIDTAGHEAQLPTEASPAIDMIRDAAQQMMHDQRQGATVAVLCLDSSRRLNEWELMAQQQARSTDHLIVFTKADLLADTNEAARAELLLVSSRTGQGLDELRSRLAQTLQERSTDEGSALAATAARCGESARLAGDSIQRALQLTAQGNGEELVAAELRVALEELGQVAGAVYTDDILDRIFSRFCIGK